MDSYDVQKDARVGTTPFIKMSECNRGVVGQYK